MGGVPTRTKQVFRFLLLKPDNLSSIPGIYIKVKGKNTFYKAALWSPDVFYDTHTHTHTHMTEGDNKCFSINWDGNTTSYKKTCTINVISNKSILLTSIMCTLYI